MTQLYFKENLLQYKFNKENYCFLNIDLMTIQGAKMNAGFTEIVFSKTNRDTASIEKMYVSKPFRKLKLE